MNVFWLKIIACTSMLIDHYGAIYHPYTVGYRLIGRLAFPIFAFLIANGFRHTGDRKKYLLRLSAFAVVSEVPFDLAFYQTPFGFEHQNIYFTLALGLLGLILQELWTVRLSDTLATLAALGLTATLAETLHTDYGAAGTVAIFIFAMMLKKKISFVLSGVLLGLVFLDSSRLQLAALLALLPIYFYNGASGPKNSLTQYGFYLFYPLHLLALHFLPLF